MNETRKVKVSADVPRRLSHLHRAPISYYVNSFCRYAARGRSKGLSRLLALISCFGYTMRRGLCFLQRVKRAKNSRHFSRRIHLVPFMLFNNLLQIGQSPCNNRSHGYKMLFIIYLTSRFVKGLNYMIYVSFDRTNPRSFNGTKSRALQKLSCLSVKIYN